MSLDLDHQIRTRLADLEPTPEHNAIHAVLDLHHPDRDGCCCNECSQFEGVEYPCPTIQAIATALEVTQ